VPGPGQALVGIAATAGFAPDGLRPGDAVTVLQLPAEDPSGQRPTKRKAAITPLVGRAVVQRVAGGGTAGTLVTIVVPRAKANQIAELSAQNRVALIARGQ